MGLRIYLIKRILQAISLVLIVVIISFVLIHLAPGDPAIYLASEVATFEQIEAIRKQYGLDKPLYEQLCIYILNMFQGNLGISLIYNTPVLELIFRRIPATVILVLGGQLFGTTLGILVGVYAAKKYGSKVDLTLWMVSLALYSAPVFIMGLVYIYVFAVNLRWFPISGMMDITANYTGLRRSLDYLHHAILPILSLGLFWYAQTHGIVRSSLVEVMHEDYITAARVKGLDERTILYKHALRNALLPTITLIGIRFGFMFGGALMTETIFGWQGMGLLTYDAIQGRDYPLLMGIFIIVSISVVIATLVVDVIYALIDPRVRLA